jgi:subtilase family serine protease
MLVGAIGATAAMAGMTIIGPGGPAAASPGPPVTALAGSVAAFTRHTQAIGEVGGSRQLSIQVWLRPHLAAAADFATAVSTPGSPLFHHYLRPAGYTARFGPAESEVSKVESWLRGGGFTGIRADSQRSYVRATAATATIDKAFGVRLRFYQASAAVNAGPYRLRANDRAISIPDALTSSVLGVTGLDNAAPVFPFEEPGRKPGHGTSAAAAMAASGSPACSHYYGQHKATGLPRQFGVTAFPTEICGYTARQTRAVYGASAASTGRGQTIALVELGLTPDMFLTLQDYAKVMHMPAPSRHRYAEVLLGRGNACGDPGNIEEQLDVEASYDMATAAKQLVVGGDGCDEGDFGLQGLFNADIAILDGAGNHPLASVASNSWEGGGETQPASLNDIEHAFLVRSAAEGVGMYFSSGDASGVATPSNDPFAIAVGGTTLGIGKTGRRLFETGWSDGASVIQDNQWVLEGQFGASGGGPSLLWRQPRYQKGVVPPALSRVGGDQGAGRAVPDLSADADATTGFGTGLLTFDPTDPSAPPTFGLVPIGGTSLATPLVAGMVIAAQQGQSQPFGLINPAIYQLAGTAAFRDVRPLSAASPALFRGVACAAAVCGTPLLATFEDQNPDLPGYTGQVTLKGYDTMTGVGTPDGPKFIRALRGLEK